MQAIPRAHGLRRKSKRSVGQVHVNSRVVEHRTLYLIHLHREKGQIVGTALVGRPQIACMSTTATSFK